MGKIINPYNFVSFGEDILTNKKKREEKYRSPEDKLLSGWMDVKLIPSTPLIIPDGAHPKYVDPVTEKVAVNPDSWTRSKMHKEYDFMYRYDENGQKQYYIPGSSIRGMIRSVYEAATDSCVPFLLAEKKKPISQRVPLYAALKNRGLLSYENDENKKGKVWKLYSTYVETEEVKVIEEKKTYLDKGGRKEKSVFRFVKADGTEITNKTGTYIRDRGVLQYNVPVDISKTYHVAYLRKKELVYTWNEGDDEAYRLLYSVLERDNVKGNQINRNEKQANELKETLLNAKSGKGNLVPVYYFKVIRRYEDHDEELVYLSNSSAGRIAQKRKWIDIMAEHGPCEGEKLCPACLLFGTKNAKYGLRSRIRITDALPEKGNLSEMDFSEKTLDILGEPRTSAFEFYLQRPEEASYWNFDFYGKSETDENEVNHTRYYDMAKATPRGRKMYWHGKPTQSDKKTKLNSTMKAVEKEVPFVFKVYFDEITKEQLDSLIWVLTLGENKKDSRYQHKLGHAKPLGYGSVKLVVKGKQIRAVERDENRLSIRITPEDVPPNPAAGIDTNKQYIKEIIRMSDVYAVGENEVGYPIGPDGKIFSWFGENRLSAKTVKTLPSPLDDTIVLESAIRNKRNKKEDRVTYSAGEIVEAKVERKAANEHGQYGVFVLLNQGNARALLHRKQMRKNIAEYSDGDVFKVKIVEIKEKYRGKTKIKEISVTDKL